jgi:protein-disulfide isomerase
MSDLTVEVTERDHRRGPDDAPVTLVAYCDFQCTDCADSYYTVKGLLQKYGPQLRYVFRNLPLTTIHPTALTMARYAEAADRHRGLFWGFHDFVFENRHLIEHPHRLLDEVAVLGLDVEWIRREASDPTFDSRIVEDVASAKASNVTAVPTYFVNGRRLDGDISAQELENAIEAELRVPVAV